MQGPIACFDIIIIIIIIGRGLNPASEFLLVRLESGCKMPRPLASECNAVPSVSPPSHSSRRIAAVDTW